MAWPAFPPFVPSDLHEAVVLDKLDEMIELIRGGSNVNGKDPTGRTPLDYCVTLDANYNHATPEGRPAFPLPHTLDVIIH